MKKASVKPSKSMKKVESPGTELCFVIMPFGAFFEKYYEEIYFPAIKKAGLEPKKADDLFRPSPIINDIWNLTNSSRLLLADLTQKNPNVFYELGLAHALSKPVILIAPSMEDVPYDLRSLRVLLYDKNVPNWGSVLMENIIKYIKEVLASPNDAVLPTFIKTSPKAEPPTVSKLEKTIIQMRQDIDSIRRDIATQTRFPVLSSPTLDSIYGFRPSGVPIIDPSTGAYLGPGYDPRGLSATVFEPKGLRESKDLISGDDIISCDKAAGPEKEDNNKR
jgi:hypothetical protein